MECFSTSCTFKKPTYDIYVLHRNTVIVNQKEKRYIRKMGKNYETSNAYNTQLIL